MKAFLVLIGLLLYLFFVPQSAAQEAYAAESPPGPITFAVTCLDETDFSKYGIPNPDSDITVLMDGPTFREFTRRFGKAEDFATKCSAVQVTDDY